MSSNKIVVEYLDGIEETLYGTLVELSETVFQVVGDDFIKTFPYVVVRSITEDN